MFNSFLLGLIFLVGSKPIDQGTFSDKDVPVFKSVFTRIFQAGLNKNDQLMSLKGKEQVETGNASSKEWKSPIFLPGFCCSTLEIGESWNSFASIHEINSEDNLLADKDWLVKQLETILGKEWRGVENNPPDDFWSHRFDKITDPEKLMPSVLLTMTHPSGDLPGKITFVLTTKKL